MNQLQPFIRLNDRQHGFKPNYSTFTACLVLKETVSKCINEKFNVHACFIDFKKTFESVNHELLINQLLNRAIQKIFVKTIQYWHKNQFVNVRYKSSFSEKWKITNGVRQGGVLSGLFFTLYIDKLIENVSRSQYGCKLGMMPSNIIVYADDIVIHAPSRSGLKFLTEPGKK